ncbi:hypothetical protein F0562_012072 [Nyssa sinensis]|uniref:Uncharacterized protein n=1 Tax=Nyssa sinensis TaxID=561372 RepID=A0A5J4ZU56_9ASTE|nr:hypothetical protein F0562_012072 [Nyssa sinensis]
MRAITILTHSHHVYSAFFWSYAPGVDQRFASPDGGRDTPMDYDDNDFQGQNLHLAGEGSSKFSPVLRPYALPKFDFDDSLHGHLRFDSLVENEVFLGIPSQEDNQWIEDFSRGSSGIEFSSSAAESCSISRRNNVWSEATSSESVEMLLKSVGQEEMVPGETIVEESDTCDELGSLNKQMEPNLNIDDGMKGVIDLHPALPPDGFLENSSGLNEGAGGECPHVERTSQTQEAEPSNCGSSSELDPNAVSEKCGLFVTQKNLGIDKKCDNANQGEVDILVNESLDKKMQKDPSVSGMQIDNVDSSSQDIIASVGELNNQEIPHQVSDVSFKNANGSPKDIGKEVEEHHVVSNEANMNDQDLKVHIASKLESVEGNAGETRVNNCEEPSSLPAKGDADLQIAVGCSEDVLSTDPVQGSKCGVVDSSKSTEIKQQFNGNMHEESPVMCSNDQDDGKKNNYAENLSNLMVVCSSTELLVGKHGIENLKGVNHSSGIHKEDSNNICRIPPQICEGDLISNQLDVQCVQNVSFNKKGNVKLPTDSNNMDCDTVGSLNMDKKVGYLSLDKSIKENDIIVDGSEYDTTASKEPALDVALETTNLASNNTLDGVPSLSGSGANADEVHDHSEEQKLPLLVEGFMHLAKKEETKVEVLTEASSLTLKECLDGASDPVKEDNNAEAVVVLENHEEATIEKNLEVVSFRSRRCSTNSKQRQEANRIYTCILDGILC